MKTFLKFLGIIVGIFVVVGLILPNKIDVRRSVVIDAPVADIHQYLHNLDNWSKWSPWVELDPTIKTTIGDIRSGKGASQFWSGNSGGGNLTITESSLTKGVIYDLNFDGDSTVYESGYSYQEKDGKLLVTWFMTGEMQPIIIGNYFALLMDSLVGDSFVTGLNKLKAVVEKQAIQKINP